MFVPCHPSTARRRYPFAAVVARVCGGSAVFFTVTDYRTWCNQR